MKATVKSIFSPTLVLADGDGKKEIRVSVPVTRAAPVVGTEIEISDPLEQSKPVFNAAGIPTGANKYHNANLISKTAATLEVRETAPAVSHAPSHHKK